ncbi:MAG: agmatinase [Solirubrobacterales bacterium]|nr:agmatinase [Solirubrobacterales bacterium]MBV9715520.1 agmatinase [Solirubrobacterales bacterium]
MPVNRRQRQRAASGSTPRFQPPDASVAPRYTGPRTFARLPQVELPHDDVDAAVIGVPFDTATSFRTGARFGPEAIRSASALLRPYHPELDVDVFGTISAVDGGDIAITPGNARRTAEQIDAALQPLLRAGIVPLVLGGDHSIVLGELRAQAAVHGPVALILLDAHADTWDQYYGERYFHGTPFRRAVEERLLDPSRSVLAGMRGPLYAAADLEAPREMGFEVITGIELQAMSAAEYGKRVHSRAGAGPAYLSFDIDVLDPAFAPATGTPEVSGLYPREALALLRALDGIDLRGFDVVEVSPPYDSAGQVTALHAAAVAFELLALLALARR